MKIEGEITSFETNAFAYSNIENMTIFLKITVIKEKLFFKCSMLNSLEFHANLVAIEPYAFAGCQNLTLFPIHESVKSIGAGAFSAVASTEIVFPSSITEIENDMFTKSSKLQSIVFKGDVTVIGSNVFPNCESLESIEIPKNVESIGTFALQA